MSDSKQLDKLESKFDKMDERLDNIDKTMERNTAILDEHHRRTTALEAQVLETESRFIDSLKPLQEQHNNIKYVGKTLHWMALAGAAILGVLQGLKELGLI